MIVYDLNSGHREYPGYDEIEDRRGRGRSRRADGTYMEYGHGFLPPYDHYGMHEKMKEMEERENELEERERRLEERERRHEMEDRARKAMVRAGNNATKILVKTFRGKLFNKAFERARRGKDISSFERQEKESGFNFLHNPNNGRMQSGHVKIDEIGLFKQIIE